MKTKETIYNQHEENVEALNKLAFYKDEIKILTDRLEEIASKNTDKSALSEVERFQNQFKIQRNNIDNIKHDIKSNEGELQKEVNANPVAVDHRSVPYHKKEKEMIDSFEKNFNDLREDFKRFSVKWM